MQGNLYALKKHILFSKKLYFTWLFLATVALFFGQTHKVPNSGNDSWTTCSGTLYDDGGSGGNYGNNVNGYTVINPLTPGNVIKISGSITVERGDYITIYEGSGTTGAILFGGSDLSTVNGFCQTFTIPTITSTSGSITVKFQSDFSNSCSGFNLNVSCVSPCSTSAVVPSPSTLYINEFQFVGVLNTPPSNVQVGPAAYSAGYQNYTSFTPVAQQPQNTAINVFAKTNGTTGGSWKAWVDWSRDGDFNDAGEEVYKMVSFTTPSVTFGFVIPSTALGNYTLRIGTYSKASDFTACPAFLNNGEYEDYLFNVVTDCPAKVLSVNDVNTYDGERCGPGSVVLSATGNASAVNYKWYANSFGGAPIGTGNVFNTPSISSTTTYYVTAVSSGGCETAYRYPVEARIDPNPTVTFSTSDPAICGEEKASLLVSASGDKYQDVYYEKFDSGLGVFNNVVAGDSFTDGGGVNISNWLNKPTPYIPTVPPYEGLSPAFASGYFGGNYAIINSDINRTTSILNHLVSNNFNVNGFLNLKVDFDMYHFSIAQALSEGYVGVDYSLDGGTTWNVLIPQFFSNVGNPFIWQHFSVNIPGGPFTSTQFKLRFSHFSKAQSSPNKFFEAITTVDNIRIYGFKTINTPFNWASPTVSLYDAATCTTPIGSTLSTTVCVKPNATQLEDLNWTLNANATFSNGCPAIGSYVVNNSTKTWRQPGLTDWNLGPQWRPTNVPDITKCVIVRTPVELPSGTNGSARNVIVKSGGTLNVKANSSLTLQNYAKNEAAASAFVVESDAGLKQNDDAAVNTGSITVNRNAQLKRFDYNYWGTPVSGQNLRNFSINTLTNRFYVYREQDDYFDGVFSYSSYTGFTPAGAFPLQAAGTYNFASGKGYAVRAPNNYTSSVVTFPGSFVGVPNNGIVNVPINCTTCTPLPPAKGNNLIANPYPSNIDFQQLYTNNSSLIYNTYYVWTNTNTNPKMQGVSYPGTGIVNNYALYNSTGGLSAPYGFTGAGTNTPVAPSSPPNRYIKVGQGFIVKAKSAGTLAFNNSVRTTNNTAVFFNRNAAAINTDDRFWLSLRTPLDFVTPLLIGYKEGATNDFELDYDSEPLVVGTDAFYSILNDTKKLSIQGRYPFSATETIPLGAGFYMDGSYTIGLDSAEGIFANGQEIFLRDKLTNTVTNLSQQNYTFNAQAGEVNDRFEILFDGRVLGTDNNAKTDVVIYKENGNFVINAPENIRFVRIYDASGKLISTSKVADKTFRIDASNFAKGVYTIDIQTSSKQVSKKLIK